MQVNLEQVISDVRALLPDDQERLRQWLDEQAARSTRERQRQEKFEAEAEQARQIFQWLEENGSQYLGQWVALDGCQLIAHGNNAKEVYEQAKAAGVKAPLVHFLEAEKLPFGGW